MEIKIGDFTFSSEHGSVGKTHIIVKNDGVKIANIDSGELKTAIEALEKSCWRPQ